MRGRAPLGHAVAGIAIGTAQRMNARAHESDYYKMMERTQQFQFGVSGTLGLLPIENNIAILFDIMFLYEYGMRRDSQLLEPLTHFGWSNVSGPKGCIPYAHVTGWKQDLDENYVGCSVTAGVHNPLIGLVGADTTTSLNFSGTLHVSFQGYGVPLDPTQDEA